MKIVIAGSFPPAAQRRIEDTFPEDWELKFVSPAEIGREIGTADVLIPEHVPVDAALLKRAPALKLVQTGAGYNNVDLDACTEHGVKVCNAAGVNADAVAEHVMALLLCRYKNLIYLDGFMKARRDEQELDYAGAELSGKTIGIIGLGHVGRRVAAYCRAFGMRVLGLSRNGTEIPCVERKSLEEICRESDVISIHVPLRESTRHMFREDQFRMMKKDAVLINTSRGAVIDEAQLIRALNSGQIAGACLDVFEEEPLDPNSPLREMDQVILTPHTAGLPDGVKYHKKRYEFFIRNILKVQCGERPECWLNEESMPEGRSGR